jgi:hypothetical protein
MSFERDLGYQTTHGSNRHEIHHIAAITWPKTLGYGSAGLARAYRYGIEFP